MGIEEFITHIPVTTRDRDSKIKDAVNSGRVYVTIINKNNKKHFKLYFKDGNTIKSKQLKVTDVTKKYILKNINIVTLSDGAREYLDIH